MTIHGLDVSNNNGPVVWADVAGAGFGFTWAKASEGSRTQRGFFTDPTYAANHDGARRAGMYAGGYHFARPAVSGPIEQADWFCNILGPLRPGDLAPCLDLEDTGGLSWAQVAVWGDQFAARVHTLTGRNPVIYLNQDFYDHLKPLWAGLGTVYPVWLATLTASPTRPCLVWQKSWTGRVPGIYGDVDLDDFLGTPEQLHILAGITDTPVPPHEEDDMKYRLYKAKEDSTGAVYAVAPGHFQHVQDPAHLSALVVGGLVPTNADGSAQVQTVLQVQLNQIKDVVLAANS